jgi:hypothetical protein
MLKIRAYEANFCLMPAANPAPDSATPALSPYGVPTFTLWGKTFTLCVNPQIECGFTHKVKLDDAFFQ